jgi:hypothetical protein
MFTPLNQQLTLRSRDQALYLHRNAINASIVSSGRFSMSQCPVPFKSTDVTVVAKSFICRPRIALGKRVRWSDMQRLLNKWFRRPPVIWQKQLRLLH